MDAQPGLNVFSATADVQFKFASQSKIVLKTTGFTRIRLPVVTIERKGTKDIHTERIVFMTSADRTIVAANSSRIVNEANVLSEFEHNTPLVIFHQAFSKMSVDIYSSGAVYNYQIDVATDNRYWIPAELSVKSNNFTPKLFDADLPVKKFSN